MAQDDMHVVMYKILSYLYTCLKEDEKPKKERYSYIALNINPNYWSTIMAELAHRRLIKGVKVTTSEKGDDIYVSNVRITMEGVEFLMENSMMAKAREFLIDVKAAVPFI